MENNYSENIMQILRTQKGIKKSNKLKDNIFLDYSKEDIFKRMAANYGVYGQDNIDLLNNIKDILKEN